MPSCSACTRAWTTRASPAATCWPHPSRRWARPGTACATSFNPPLPLGEGLGVREQSATRNTLTLRGPPQPSPHGRGSRKNGVILSVDKQEEIEGLAILVRDLRKHKNVTLGELAERIGRSVGFLSQVERGLS